MDRQFRDSDPARAAGATAVGYGVVLLVLFVLLFVVPFLLFRLG